MARRAQHDAQFWGEHIARHQVSGLSVREYCQQENLQAQHFYYWRKRAEAVESKSIRPRAASALVKRLGAGNRQAVLANSSSSTRAGGSSQAEPSAMIVIQLGNHTTISIPASMLEAIEAILKMAMHIGGQPQPSTGTAFRSVVVRS